MDETIEDTVRRGEVLTLVQQSVRHRDYALLRGDEDHGRLRFASGRRSAARAETCQTGPFVLTAGGSRLEVRAVGGGTVVAVGERGRRGTLTIRTAEGTAYGWERRGRRNRWTIVAGEADLLRVTADQRALRSSVDITVERDLPGRTAVLLSLIGGFLALRELQAEIDGAGAVGGIVAAGAG